MIKIPGYSIVRPLGKGGMAEVYLAIQQSFEREVALKILAPNLAEDAAFTERFISEARIVSRLVHPNIVTVYDVGVEGDHHYLSMEYIPGLDLKQARYNLPLSRRLAVVKDIARALNFAGRKGYVHRDVKPDNIMLHAEDGRAVLMDFGIARPSGGLAGMTQTGTTLGTPHYMSPEQARGWGVDPRSDLYSLGVVLYLLLVGRVPFDADSAVAVGVQHVSEPVPRLPWELRVFQPILDRVLAKNPEHRYQSGGDFVTALDALPQDELESLEFSLFKHGDSSQASAVCCDSAPTMAVTVPTVKRLVIEEGSNQAGYEDTRDAGYQGQFNRRHGDSESVPEEKSRNSTWPWWVGVGIAASIGYGVYFQQQLPVEERLQPIAALEQRLPALAEGMLAEMISASGSEADAEAEADTETNTETGPDMALAMSSGPSEYDSALVSEAAQASLDPSGLTFDSDVERVLTAFETEEEQAEEIAEEGELEEVSAEDEVDESAAQPVSEPRVSVSQQVAQLLEKARRQRQLGDVLMPVNANELFTLRQVLELDSDNSEARQAVADIENGLIQRVELRVQQQDWDDARAEIARALMYFPASKRLQVLKFRNEQAVLAASRPKIARVLVSHKSLMGVDQPQEHFLPAMDELHVGFTYENFEPGAAVVRAHLFEEDRQIELAQVDVAINQSRGEQFLSFERTQQAFDDGVYRVDLTFQGRLLGSSVFEISHPPQL